MKERYYTVPNLITFYRFLSALFIFMALFITVNKWVVLVIYILAVITDKLDGVVARRFQQETKFGEVLETFTDTILTGVILVYVLVNFDFPFLIFAILFIFFIAGLLISTIYFVFLKEFYSRSLITSKISVCTTYTACLFYFFDFSYNYYIAFIALIVAGIAFINFLFHVIKSLIITKK